MSLNTNGWDYGYHIKLDKVNENIKTNSIADDTSLNMFVNNLSINILSSPNNITDLNKAIYDELIKNTTSSIIKSINLYKDLPDNFLSTFILPTNLSATDNILDYLLKWLDAILKHIHTKVNNRESLVAWYNKINSTNYENFLDVDDAALIKNRGKIYLEYSYYSKIYDLQTQALQNYNQLSHRYVSYLHTTTNFTGTGQVDLLNSLIKTLLSALVPVKYIDKAIFFTNDKSILSITKNNFVIKFSGLSKWQFILKGNVSLSKIKYNPVIEVIEITNGSGLASSSNVLDTNSTILTSLNFDVDLNLNWLNNANKLSSKIVNESTKLNSILESLDISSNPALF